MPHCFVPVACLGSLEAICCMAVQLFVVSLCLSEGSTSLYPGIGLSCEPFTQLTSLWIVDLFYLEMLEANNVVILSPGKDQMINFKHSDPILHCKNRTLTCHIGTEHVDRTGYLVQVLTCGKTFTVKSLESACHGISEGDEFLCESGLCIDLFKDGINIPVHLTYPVSHCNQAVHGLKSTIRAFLEMIRCLTE